MSDYTPRHGTDTFALIKMLVEKAPNGSEKWLLSKSIAEEAGLESQQSVHQLLSIAEQRGMVLRKMVDERLRWQAGPGAAEAIARAAKVQPLAPIGFPNVKERQPVVFEAREGGSIDRAIKFLRANPERTTIAEPELCQALDLAPDTDLKKQFQIAVDAGALAWTALPCGSALVRHWSLGDGLPPHRETFAAPRGKRPAPPAVQEKVHEPVRVEAAQEPAKPVAPLPPMPSPRGASMAFRCGFFTDGLVTIQKGHGAVELNVDEALVLYEHLGALAHAHGRKAAR